MTIMAGRLQAYAEPFGATLRACPACGSADIGYWASKSFSYTLGRADLTFDIHRCGDCGSGFLNPPPSMEFLAEIYAVSGHGLTRPVTLAEVEGRELRFPNSTVDADRMAACAAGLDLSGTRGALDVGSGYGFATRALRRLGYGVVSVNPGAYENAVFAEMNGAPPLPILFEDYHPDRAFGIVHMSQVLEHMLEPRAAMRKVADLLAPGGVVACAVPNFGSAFVRVLGTRDNACLWVPEHVNHFSASGLRRLMADAGLEVMAVAQVSRVPYDALSRRLRLAGPVAALADMLVRVGQVPVCHLMNLAGMGAQLNVYARKPAG